MPDRQTNFLEDFLSEMFPDRRVSGSNRRTRVENVNSISSQDLTAHDIDESIVLVECNDVISISSNDLAAQGVDESIVLVECTDLVTQRPKTSQSLSTLIAGIDQDIKRIFLELPERKLTKVFLRYGEIYGIGKVIYAKNTYPKWKSGETTMSGVIVARLLNLVPLVLEADAVYVLVKKIRNAYLRMRYLEVECDTANWFKKLPPIVDGLVKYSDEFELPEEVLEKLYWLANGNAKAAQELLAAAEVEEANVRTQYLNREYARISRMLSNAPGMSSFNHTIELPQGVIAVTIRRPVLSILERLPLAPMGESGPKRALRIICKNPRCKAEMETSLTAYDGEPIDCASSEITCTNCQQTYIYTENDLKRTRRNLNVEVRKGLFGGYSVFYDCPLCTTRLNNPIEEAGRPDSCPNCKTEFVVPNS